MKKIASEVLCAVLLAAACAVARSAPEAEPLVELRPGQGDTMEILIGDQPFATYNFGKDLPKPFLLPIRTASGVVINRALREPSDDDHPHHKGLWFSVDEVNGQDFWAEKAPIVCVSVKAAVSGADPAVMEVINEWRHPESRQVILTETTQISIHASRLVSYHAVLKAAATDVVFDDTKEGLFGFRMAPTMKEKHGGHVISSDGSTGTQDCWGRTFAWIDYFGTVDQRTVGVTLMDHPGNFRPSRYHVRDYGLFSLSPFGEHSYTNGTVAAQPVTVKAGESLRLHYGAYFHDGDTVSADVAAIYGQFLKTSGAAP